MNENVTGISTFGLMWLGREATFSGGHPYLFVSKRGEEPFIYCMQDLHELNDFCVTLFEASRQRAKQAKSFNQATEGLDFDSEEFNEFVDVYTYGYDESTLGRVYAPASALVMLYANLIRSLKRIAKYYGREIYEDWDKNRERSGAEMRQLRKLLETIANQNLTVFDQDKVKKLLDREIRNLRNSFMHGDWEAVERQIIGINIRAGFGIASKILDALEAVFTEDNFPDANSKRIINIA